MTDTKHIDVRGKNISEIVEIAAATIDEIVEENQINLIIDMQDAGHTVEDAEAVLESQRARMAGWRKKTLADLKKWLGRDETFNLLSSKQMTPHDRKLAAEAYVRTRTPANGKPN
jgi:hypothetical protein